MKATPSTTDSAVSDSRSLWASRLLYGPFSTSSVAQALHAVEDGSARRIGHLVDDATVGEEDDPVGVAGRDRVVGHHDDRLAELAARRCA